MPFQSHAERKVIPAAPGRHLYSCRSCLQLCIARMALSCWLHHLSRLHRWCLLTLQSQPGYGAARYSIQKLPTCCLFAHTSCSKNYCKKLLLPIRQTATLRAWGKAALHKPHCFVSWPMLHLCLSGACMEAEELKGTLFFFHWHVENTFHTITAHLSCLQFTEDTCGAVQLTVQIGPGWGWVSVLKAENSLCRLAGLWLRDTDNLWRNYTPVQQPNTKGTFPPCQQNSLSASSRPCSRHSSWEHWLWV